jgi:hypothetical protein
MSPRRQIGPVRLIASCVVLIALVPIVGYFTYVALSTGEIRLPRRDGGGVVTKATAPSEYWLWIAGHAVLLLFVSLKVPSQIRKARFALTQ